MWTKESLNELTREKLSGYLFLVVSNREPYIHVYSGRKIQCQMPPSGLTVALDPVMQACGGTWVAHGSGNADRRVVDGNNIVAVPPENAKYSLKRVWLSKKEQDEYYYGFSNEALWPLCHVVYTKPIFRVADWNTYCKVNELFAQSVLEEVGDRKAFVFIQDYHLALVSQILKQRNPNIITAQFWHIPWPNPEAFRICPWQAEILEGLLGNDLLGFHINYHVRNFIDSVERAVEARINRETSEITYVGKSTAIRSFPISVDFDEIDAFARQRAVSNEIRHLKSQWGLKQEQIGIGLDRIDYTKGIPDRFRALDRFFEMNPQYIENMVFIQAGAPSRVHIDSYQSLNQEIEDMAEEINWKYGTGQWKPILLIRENLPPVTVSALRRMARFCIVSSLHDGMNLVAKEYIANHIDEDGVLILSRFTGAARELSDALIVNPYATDHFADAIKTAVEMPRSERHRRMKRMREIVRENNIYKWAADVITELVKFEFGS